MADRGIDSPWPQLAPMFKVKDSKDKVNLCFECLLCRPQQKMLSCSRATNSNLRTHIKVTCIFVLITILTNNFQYA